MKTLLECVKREAEEDLYAISDVQESAGVLVAKYKMHHYVGWLRCVWTDGSHRITYYETRRGAELGDYMH